MRRALSAREIAELEGDSGPIGQYAPYVESVFMIDEDDANERARRYELRVKGVTGTFCAEYFSVDVIETAPDSCLIEWSVRMPNGHEHSLDLVRRSGGLDLETLQVAFRLAVATAISWGRAFRDIVPAKEMAEAFTEIAAALTNVKLQLETVETASRGLPGDARAALDEALRGVGSRLPSRVAALEELVARLFKPVDPQR